MYDAKWDLKGFDAVFKKMRGLSPALKGEAGRSALGSAARVVTNAAKNNALRVDDSDTGRKIASNVVQRYRSKRSKATGDVIISVGVATEKGRIPKGNPDTGPKGNTPHWHLIELGTEKARAQPFLRPALESNIGNVQTVFAEKLEKQLDKLVK
jgi:HK97 gp10 family phage protein